MSWRMTTGGTACRRIMAAGQSQEHCLKPCTKSTMGCTASSRRCRLSWRRSLPLSVEVRGRPFMQRAFCYQSGITRFVFGLEGCFALRCGQSPLLPSSACGGSRDASTNRGACVWLRARCMQQPAQVALCRDGPDNGCLLAEVARHSAADGEPPVAAVEKAVQNLKIKLETVDGRVSSFTASVGGNPGGSLQRRP